MFTTTGVVQSQLTVHYSNNLFDKFNEDEFNSTLGYLKHLNFKMGILNIVEIKPNKTAIMIEKKIMNGWLKLFGWEKNSMNKIHC